MREDIVNKIRNDMPVSLDNYVICGKDYLIEHHYVRNEQEFNNLIDNKREWGYNHHFHWSKDGIDLLIYHFTNKRTLKDLIKVDQTL